MRIPNTALAAFLLLASAATAGDRKPDDSSWKTDATTAGLSAGDIELLDKNKILVSHAWYKQSFSAYLGGKVPFFITTDSLLNGYHVLYEELISRLESAQAQRLPKLLGDLWQALKNDGLKLDGKPELAAAARKRARLVVGVALELVGDKAAREDRDLTPLIQEEARRIVAAAGAGKPQWLGPPDNGFQALDYTRYRPRGFYTRNDQMQRYFRAVSWLQSIPFRVDNDEELLAALVLGNAVRNTEGLYGKWQPACRAYQDFVGAGDDWDLLMMEKAADGIGPEGWEDAWPDRSGQRGPRLDLGGKDLEKIRTALKKHAAGKESPAINDQVRFIPDDPRQPAEPGFRILSAYRLPDAVLFQRTTDPRSLKRDFPDGLEIGAVLGSTFARERLGGKSAGSLLKALDDSKGLLKGGSLYCEYLRCLEALVVPAEHDAPPLFKSEAWRIKSCQTALAGWAQIRHTWVLQGKQNVTYLSSFQTPAGFVEPNPEFYVRLGNLARRTGDMLDQSKAMGADLLDLAAKLRLVDAWHKSGAEFKNLSPAQITAIHDVMELSIPGSLTKLAEQLETGKLPDNSGLREQLLNVSNIGPLWEALVYVCDRLELLAHKQLRGVAFNNRDEEFIRDYGTKLARIMLYKGNSYITPEDDAPRIVDVFSNPTKGTVLEVGIGRPRAFYLLYPWKGREVLCEGAVLPYYEFTHSSRLDDRGWKSLLDSRDAPASPGWVRPILSATPVKPPTAKE